MSTAIETEHVLNLHREAILSNLKQTKIMIVSLHSEPNQNFLKLLKGIKKLIQNPAIKNIMRIGIVTITLLIATSLQLLFALPVKSQPIDKVEVTLGLNNETLVQAFQKIEAQSPFHFMYRNKEVKSVRNLKVKNSKQSVEDFLKTILAGTSLTYRQVNNQILIVPVKNDFQSPAVLSVSGHEKLQYVPVANIVTGRVTNTKGEPLVGVSVTIRGATTGTSTDGKGSYSIDVPANGTLIFSYVGFATREIAVNGRSSVDVKLEESVSALDQVVVVGYGTKKKGEVTGSIASISGDALVKNRTTNLVKGLQGTVPGLIIKDVGGAPGREDATILIRGTHTLGDNSPLFVVDGVPQSSITQLSPYDIEEISVLKDASAAIYGARAANGVIIVTTKRGKQGKTQLQFNSSYGVNSLTREPKLMNSWQYAIYRNETFERRGLPIPFSDDDIAKYKSGSDPLTHPNTNWYDAAFKKYAHTSDNNINVSGGSEKVKFFVSGGYHQEGTNYSSNDGYYRRYQLRSNVDVQVNKYLKLGADLNLRLQENRQPPAGIVGITHRAWFNYPTEVARFPNGLPGTVHEDGNTTVINSFETGYDEQISRIVQPRLSFDLNMDWLTEGLQLIGYASFNYNLDESNLFQKPVTTYTYNPATEEYLGHQTLYPGSGHVSLNQTSSVSSDYLYHIRLAYSRRFGDHGISAFAAYEQDETRYHVMSAGRRDLFSENKVELFAGQEDGRTVGGSASDGGRVNYFGTFSYDYKRKYLVDFTIRNDGSFNFPPESRFGVFPGMSAAWNISKEPFMSGVNKTVDNLKLRFSYGKMGNDRIPNYQYITKYATGTFAIFGTGSSYNPAISISNIPNPNITWEISNMLNYGLDATLLKEKLSITIDYFNEKRRGILITRSLSVPLYTAITLPPENLGKVDNWGVEFSANYADNAGDFSYRVGGNFTFNRSRIVYMDEPKNIPIYQRQEGHPVNSFLAYESGGLFRDQAEVDKYPHLAGTLPGDIKYLDVNGDGKITNDDRKRFYKSSTPEIQAGLNASLNYKGFDLFILFQAQTNATTVLRFNDDGTKPVELFTDRWTEENKDAKMPRAMQGRSPQNLLSSFNFIDASYIRLKNLELGYNLSSHLISKNVLQECRIYLRARNLWTLDHVKIFDPEVPLAPDERGSRARYYPQLITYSVGVNITL